MKQISRFAAGVAAAVFSLGVLAAPVLAEETSSESTSVQQAEPTPTPDPFSDNGVYISAVAVTDAAGGEVATVERDDRVNIVLKVVDHSSARYNVQAEEIHTRINSSIFTYTGIGEISQLVEGEDTDGRYYSYVLLFRDVIYNGGGDTLDINLSYADTSMEMQQFSTKIGQCVDEDPKTPSLMVRESSYGSETIIAGTPFTLSMTVYATAGEESLDDVMATVTLPEGLTLTGGSLSNYIGSISPRGTKNVYFEILPAAGFTGGVANISVSLTGVGRETGAPASGSCNISVPVAQPDRFELGNLECPQTLMVGEEGTVTLNFVNKGKNTVSNLEASISGVNLGFEGSQVQYVGNVAPGTENSVEFDLAPTEAGGLSGTITLTYELEDGSQKSLTKDFSSTVEEMPVYDDSWMYDPGMTDPEPAQTGVPAFVWVLAAIGVVVVIVVVVVVVRKKRKAAAMAALEDVDSEDL